MSASERRAAFLHEMGIEPVWQRRTAPSVEVPLVAEPSPREIETVDVFGPISGETSAVDASGAGIAPSTLMSPPEVASMDWMQLKSAVVECTKCGLCAGRANAVFGVGDEKAKWLFVGEAPGRNEDQRGEPFVGQAGKLLDNMLLAMGLRRGDNAYIANIIKCRPTDETGRDRPPTPAETAACMPYLERQIALIQPSIIVALGKTAAISLLGLEPETPVSKLRGSVHRYADRPLIVTYHPAYLLRNMGDKKKAWADLCLAMATYACLR